MSRSNTHTPARNDPVWVARRHEEGKQPNGYVFVILWQDREVVVRYYDNAGKPSNDYETFELEDFRHKFVRMGGGAWHFNLEPGDVKQRTD